MANTWPATSLAGGSIPARARSRRRNNTYGSLMPDQTVKSPENARAGSKEGVVRYVLAISIALVVILFVVGYLVS
jgi:hypothetical protein